MTQHQILTKAQLTRALLEAQWNAPGVAFPMHLTRWEAGPFELTAHRGKAVSFKRSRTRYTGRLTQRIKCGKWRARSQPEWEVEKRSFDKINGPQGAAKASRAHGNATVARGASVAVDCSSLHVLTHGKRKARR